MQSVFRAPSRRLLFAFAGSAAVLAAAMGLHAHIAAKGALTKARLARMLGDAATFYKFPSEIDIPLDFDGRPDAMAEDHRIRAGLKYTFNPELQQSMEALFDQYRPDYGAFVAVDAKTGEVLSMVSYSRHASVQDNLALRATFPSASVFKVVTAAAAIEEKNLSPETVIPYNGRNHTLYRGNVLRMRYTRWTRYITLKEAFARSINTVFAKIGAFTVGPEDLRTYADRFGFNRAIASDMPMQPGRAPIPDDPWGLAETASGFTRDNTMSPLQGAMIAAAIADDGVMMEPYVVRTVISQDGTEVYRAEPKISTVAVDNHTAGEIRALMRETVKHGTSRGSFRGFFKGGRKQLDVGGKTGSLTGTDPRGRYDWFVGFADGGDRKIAVAALTVHEKFWRVKSSYLARRAFEVLFPRDWQPGERSVAAADLGARTR